ncbi:hypothetical protein BV22DRAFT_1105166 [Leucogyrophana mollusca]|uniref:Uncharacterized protein n=1 Tax=Leucogyrophana mollusca TaxID=85980 RepID=A0ACB8BIG6_9AGAM|nr:hypothetical protein BV22DRAFT_1105166 [Leucogyrophana mollusca]
MDDHDEVMQSSPRPLKRRRTSRSEGADPSIEHSSSGSNHAGNSSFRGRCWFNDGDIVLDVEGHLFKVHRSVLMCSIIFADMLELPQSDSMENVDGCPSVTLQGDSASDWRIALSWMYDRVGFASHAVTFDMLAGAMRISTKYEVHDLREWAVRELLSRWPLDLTRMNNNALPHAAEAIRLARECDIPEILPAAFYALSAAGLCESWSRSTHSRLPRA